jgi:sterol desaturase/sphingolipid hydroxylase (fatty acid hydroxylase superfamily)
MEDIILYALPVFAVLIGVEWLYGWVTGRNTYRLNDSVASLSQGLLGQCIGLCTQLFQVGLYTLVWRWCGRWAPASFWASAMGWVAAVVLFDFCDYWLHRVGHETAVFWAAHAVHHQSEDFNFSTALRQESLVALLGWPFYLPMALLGVPPLQFVAAGLIVLIYQFWIHTEHIGKLGWFDRVFSSPSNHRVHHAVNPGYINKNYGGMLVVWDRLFGTFAEEREPCIYGTQTPLQSWNPLWAVAQVYAGLWRDACRTARWRDKLRLWFMPTGWRPDDVRARWPQPAFDPQAMVRYDPPVSHTQGAYAVGAFALMTAATAGLLWRAETLSWPQTAATCAAVAAGLWSAGAVLQSRLRVRWAAAVLLAAVLAAFWAAA